MCVAVPVGIAIASAVLTYTQQADAASKTASAIKANAEAQAASTQEQYRQINQNASDKMSARAREALIETAKLRTISGETGLSGVSADRVQGESLFNSSTDIASINTNRVNALEQARLGAGSDVARSQSQLNSIRQPSLIGGGLQIAGAYANQQAEQARLDRIGTPSRVNVPSQS
jgi:hypothetical protein